MSARGLFKSVCMEKREGGESHGSKTKLSFESERKLTPKMEFRNMDCLGSDYSISVLRIRLLDIFHLVLPQQ